jgi:hypothetical protein
MSEMHVVTEAIRSEFVELLNLAWLKTAVSMSEGYEMSVSESQCDSVVGDYKIPNLTVRFRQKAVYDFLFEDGFLLVNRSSFSNDGAHSPAAVDGEFEFDFCNPCFPQNAVDFVIGGV